MGLHTGTVRGLHRAPYRAQVLTHLLDYAVYEKHLTADDEVKIARVQRFLHASNCAAEIAQAHGYDRKCY